MKFHNLILSLILASFAFSQEPAAQPDAPRPNKKLAIAILDVDLQSIQETSSKALSDLLRTEIIETDRFEVMERGQMDEVMKEQGFQQSGACTDQACIVEMGQVLGVNAMVASSVGRLGKLILINIRMIDIQSSKIVKTISQECRCELENLPLAVRVAARRLADLNVEKELKDLAAVTEQTDNEKKQEALRAQQVAAAQAAQAAAASQAQLKKESGGGGKIVLGALVLGAAGGAVYYLTSKKSDEPGDGTGTPPYEELPAPPIPSR